MNVHAGDSDSELRSGDLLFTGMSGFVPGVVPVGAGQLALFLTRRWWKLAMSVRRWWHIRHAAVAYAVEGYGVRIVQAMPKGCEIVDLDRSKHWVPSVVWIRPDYTRANVQPHAVALAAARHVGTPYNFATYLKLAAGAFRMRLTERWLLRKMSTRADMMCSQHVDQSLADAGYHAFDDGRLPQDVVPAELFNALIYRPGWFMIPGHAHFGQWTDNVWWPGDKR